MPFPCIDDSWNCAKFAMLSFSEAVVVVVLIVYVTNVVQCMDYEFVLDDAHRVFSPCASNMTNDFYYVFAENTSMSLFDDHSHVEGSLTIIWPNIEPTDRIVGEGAFYKMERGSWRLTPFMMKRNDLCSTLFKSGEMWYSVVTQHVFMEDRKCFNILGHVYRFHPFDIDFKVKNLPGTDQSGRYKIQFYLEAYDKRNKLKSNMACIAVLGDLRRI